MASERISPVDTNGIGVMWSPEVQAVEIGMVVCSVPPRPFGILGTVASCNVIVVVFCGELHATEKLSKKEDGRKRLQNLN